LGAKRLTSLSFTALFRHLGIGLFRDSFFALKRDAAPGVSHPQLTE
jgi:hypothetical protein